MWKRVVPFLVLIVTFVAFAGAFDNQFVNWDDEANFVANERWHGFSAENLRWMLTTRLLGPYQPLSWLSLGLDYTLFGSGPTGPHVGNAVYHALAALMLFLVARRLLGKALELGAEDSACVLGAFVAALAFGLHPLRVESVAWATERRDVLSGFLLAASVLLYLRALEREGGQRTRALVLAVLVYTLSLGAKAIGMTLPLVLLILDAWPLRRLSHAGGLRRCLVEKLAFVVPALVAAWIAVGGQTEVDAMLSSEQVGLADRMRLASYATVFYVVKTIWPGTLWPHYQIPLDLDFSGTVFTLALAAVVLVTLLAFFLRRRLVWLPTSWISYLVVLAPVSGLTIAGRQLAADRYSYLPGMIFALLAGGIVALAERCTSGVWRTTVRVVSVLVLATLTLRTVQQVEHWRDSRALWTHVLQNEPDSVPARNNMAELLAEAGDWNVALAHYEAARRLAPEEPAIHLNLAVHYNRLGRVEDALASAQRAAELDPELWNAAFFLGARWVELGRPEQGLPWVERAAELRPGFAPGRVLLAQALTLAGRSDRAAAEIEAALDLPGMRPPQFLTLVQLAASLGRPELARRCAQVGLGLFPGNPELTAGLRELGG